MTKETFDVILEAVCNQMNMSKEQMLTRTQRRKVVDARHIMFYICRKMEIRNVYIQEYLNDEGYSIKHNTIIHGNNKISDKLESNSTLRKVVNRCIADVIHMLDQIYV